MCSSDLKTLVQIDVGNFHVCALDSEGKAYCWGRGDYGALANGNTSDSNTPVAVDTSGTLTGKTLTTVSAGDAFSCFLDNAGLVYCAGFSNDGELGAGITANQAYPSPMPVDTSEVLAGKVVTQISSDNDYACAIDNNGQAYCWGYNGYGQLGNRSFVTSNVPVLVMLSFINGAFVPATVTFADVFALRHCKKIKF